jgi:TonB-linked SusC/RagA family outer membrane protein
MVRTAGAWLVRGGRVLAMLAAVTLPLASAAQAQQQTSIQGRVVDEATGLPLSGARLIIIGVNRTIETDQDGQYTVRNLAPGRYEIRAVRIGYGARSQAVTLATGSSVTIDFALPAAVVSLDDIVVSVTGEQRKREIGNNVATISAASEVERGAITNFSDLLSSRAAGVIVNTSSGTTGTGTKVRIRGANSLSLSNEPLIYLDGIRVDNTAATFGLNSIGVGGQQPSRLDDINPEEIESIEVIKGPSATTLYGTEAANGVIRITTKKGRPGPARWNVYVEGGIVEDKNEYPTNFDAIDTDGNAGCALVFVSLGACEQAEIQSFNVLEDDLASPIGTGNREQFGLNVSGGTDQLSYFISGEFERELGTLRLPDTTAARIEAERGGISSSLMRPNELQRVSLRANLRSQVLDNADFLVSVGYVTSDLRVPQNDNNVLGLLPSGFFGGATPETGFGFFTPDQTFALRAEQNIDRFIGSLQTNWQPFGWLSTRGAFGVDLTNQFDGDFSGPGEVPFGTRDDGTRNSNRIQVFQYTADASGTATANLSSRVQSKSSVGVQYFQNINSGTFATGNRIASGSSSLGGAVVTSAFEAKFENVTLGAFAEETFSLNDRLFVTGGVRVDDNNAFGEDFDAVAYPKVSGSWVISEESFFPTGSVLSALRLRAAWGETGVQPAQAAALRFFNPVAITAGDQDVVGVADSSLGNPNLKPERSEEVEFGFDAEFFRGRIGLDVTYYRKVTSDALVQRLTAPSLGTGSQQFVNLGSVRNRGFEANLSAQILQTRNAAWDITFRGATINNEILELGEGIEPIIFGLGGDSQRHQEGFAAGAYFANPVLGYDDADGDGVLTLDEVQVGDEAVFLGTPLAKRELSIQTSFTLFNRVRVSGLLDHRGGHKLFNSTAEFRCFAFQLCEGAVVPGADLDKQAATVARTLHSSGTVGGFVEDADFWKLRELSLTFFAPQAWAQGLGTDRLSLTLTGRNLFTITDYTGLDPEVNFSQVGNFTTADFLTQPPVRYWTARLNVTF